MKHTLAMPGALRTDQPEPSFGAYVLVSQDGRIEACSTNLSNAVEAEVLVSLVAQASEVVDQGSGSLSDFTSTCDGQTYAVRSVLLDDGRRILNLSMSDLTEAMDQPFDGLTGLLSRDAFEAAFDALNAHAQNAGERVFCLYVDLDRFKQVNDTLGHSAGDELLKKVSQRLRRCVRDSDRVFRVGGDEFVVLGTCKDAVGSAEAIALRAIDRMSRPYLVDCNQVVIGASVGAACLAIGDSSETLLKHADLALYESKRTGKGRMSWYDARMLSEADTRRQLDMDLRRALALNAFEVFFQPQFDLTTKNVVKFEALLRWRQDDGSYMDASGFVDLAEETRLITRIGEFVLEDSLRAAALWPDHIGVSVNLSEVELHAKSLPGLLARLLKEYAVDPNRLEIELKECDLSNADVTMIDNLRKIQELGVRLAIDDFASGGSSLNRLYNLRFSSLKVDSSFLELDESGADNPKLRAVLGLAETAGAQLVAERLETELQLEVAVEHGCVTAQGFLLAKPMPQGDVMAFLGKADGVKEQSAQGESDAT